MLLSIGRSNIVIFQRRFDTNIIMKMYALIILVLSLFTYEIRGIDQMDPIDECLLGCNNCFKGQVLLRCANRCLLSEYGKAGQAWASICPSLSRSSTGHSAKVVEY